MSSPILGKCSGWKAWHDLQPPGPPTLHVEGTCQFPTTGYTVELEPAKPQGINPRIYLLKKVVHTPTGIVAQKITDVPVNYVEETNAKYSDVEILPDSVRIKVEEVH